MVFAGDGDVAPPATMFAHDDSREWGRPRPRRWQSQNVFAGDGDVAAGRWRLPCVRYETRS